MDIRLDLDDVTEPLPRLDHLLEDPRLRPVGLVGGFTIVLIGAALQLTAFAGFWTSAVAGALVFIGVPLFCVGLAAPEPEPAGDPFRLGIELSREQRRLVAVGASLILFAPVIAGSLGPLTGFDLWVVFLTAVFALLGSVLVMTGFVAWTSRALAETAPSR